MGSGDHRPNEATSLLLGHHSVTPSTTDFRGTGMTAVVVGEAVSGGPDDAPPCRNTTRTQTLVLLAGLASDALLTMAQLVATAKLREGGSSHVAIVLSSLLPLAVAQCLAPWWVLKRCTYAVRVVAAAVAAVVAAVALTVSSRHELVLTSVVVFNVVAGWIQPTMLALLTFYHHSALPAFAAGTALSRLVSPALFAAANSCCGHTGPGWSTLGSGSFTAPHATWTARAVMLVVLLLWPAALAASYGLLNSPFPVLEAWAPRSFCFKVRRKVIRRAAAARTPFDAPNASSTAAGVGADGRMDAGLDTSGSLAPLTELRLPQQLKTSQLAAPILWPLLVAAALTSVVQWGVLPTMGRQSGDGGVSLNSHHTLYLLTYLAGDAVGRAYYGVVQATKPSAAEHGSVFVARTWLMVLPSAVVAAVLVAMAAQRSIAEFPVVVTLCAVSGLLSGGVWVNTMYRLARFGYRMKLDLATRPDRRAVSASDRTDTAEREFLLGVAPAAYALGLLAGALVGLGVMHGLRQRCEHLYGDDAAVRCYDTCYVNCA